jgi:hypothetical protein
MLLEMLMGQLTQTQTGEHMSKESHNNVIMFLSGLACTTVAMLILVNSDSRLKQRAMRQVSTFLDSTGRLVRSFTRFVDAVSDEPGIEPDVIEDVSAQWERIAQSRSK